jgi:hypothetical protein
MAAVSREPVEKHESLEHFEDTSEPNRSQGVGNNRDSVLPKNNGVVASEAVGGLYDEMPKGYYLSKGFLGTLAVSAFLLARIISRYLTNDRLLAWRRSVATLDGSCQQTLSPS